MIRVLHIYSGNLYGGVESLLTTLARYRDLCQDMDPHFGLCFRGRLSRELEEAGSRVHMLGGVRIRMPWTVWRARRRLRDLLARGLFSAVVVHSWWAHALFGPVVRHAGLPLILWVHGISAEHNHLLERWGSKTAPDVTLSNSEFTATGVRGLFPKVNNKVLHCPVACSTSQLTKAQRDGIRAELDTPRDHVVIIQVSRMEAWKGHRLLIQALSSLKGRSDWTCWQVGGPQRARETKYFRALHRIADQLGISDRMRFLGERGDVPRLLAAADIFCQPNSAPEPFGIVFLEALLAGLPVVTTSLGGVREILEDSCTILVPPGDSNALATSLLRLLDDATARKRLAQTALQHVSTICDPATQLAKLYALLGSSVASERAS